MAACVFRGRNSTNACNVPGGGQQEVKIFDTKRLRVRKLTPKEYGILQAFPMDDWEAAQNAVNDMLSKYAPGGYMGKIIYPLLTPLKERLEAGERTPDLYNAIVEATR